MFTNPMLKQKTNSTAKNGQRKYPLRCVACGKKEVSSATIRRKIEKNHDGRFYELRIDNLPVNKCKSCGEVYFTSDSYYNISAALREHLGLVAPTQIGA